VTEPLRIGGYQLEEQLGRGATGTVWRAAAADGSVVAVKLLDPALAGDEEYRARFAREARVAQAIPDAHLVRILEAGADEGRPFLVLEYVGGGSLAARLAHGPLGLERTLSVIADVGAALDALHRGGIVHRDVKPSNVMQREYTVLTRPGRVQGTLDYLAPELIRGEEATAASDVYALGCVAFECLAGRPPFGDRSLFGVGTAHLEDEPPDPPTSSDVAWALLRALDKDPAARPATATMYANLLRVASRS
jgi:serine/threonine protein kinase